MGDELPTVGVTVYATETPSAYGTTIEPSKARERQDGRQTGRLEAWEDPGRWFLRGKGCLIR